MEVDPNDLERIAVERLPELQTASGLFRGGEDDGGVAGTDRASIRASAVVLIGLSRAEDSSVDHGLQIGSLRTGLLNSIGLAGVSIGELGLVLWAEAVADGSASGEILAEIQRRLPLDPARLPLEELAWLVSGLSEAEPDGPLFGDMARGLIARGLDSGLLADSHRRVGGGLGAVGSQLHAVVALAKARASGWHEGKDALDSAARGVLLLQQEDGAWPALLDPRKGRVAEVYPVFTVNQLAMAPMALRDTGPEGESAIARGVEWARGGNALGFDLVHPEEARIDHGIVPRRHAGSVLRGVGKATRLIKGEPRRLDRDDLILDPRLSAEDLGWLLEAWVGRQS